MTVKFNPQPGLTPTENQQLLWLLMRNPVNGLGHVTLDSDMQAWIARNHLGRHFVPVLD